MTSYQVVRVNGELSHFGVTTRAGELAIDGHEEFAIASADAEKLDAQYPNEAPHQVVALFRQEDAEGSLQGLLSQEFVDRVTAPDQPDIEVIGPNDAPMPSKDDAIEVLRREVWKWRYIVRFMQVGFELEHALADYEGTDDHDYNQDPVDAANDSLQCYEDDGDLA